MTLQEQAEIENANCVQSKLSVVSQGKNPEGSFTFTHMLYIAWNPKGDGSRESVDVPQTGR